MIGIAMYTTRETLWKRHKNKSKIARLTSHDWKTVAKMIKAVEEGKEYPKKKPHRRVLDLCKEQIIKWMEEKLTGVRIHEELQGMGMEEMVIVSSFDQTYLKKVKQLDSGIPTGLLVYESPGYPVNCLKRIDADAYHPEISVIDLSKMGELRKEGFYINVWTVNNERTMRDLIRVRVDGIITDFPQNLETIPRERVKL